MRGFVVGVSVLLSSATGCSPNVRGRADSSLAPTAVDLPPPGGSPRGAAASAAAEATPGTPPAAPAAGKP